MNIAFTPQALADVELAAQWYIDQNARGAAQDLHAELAKALERLSLQPGLGTPGPADTRLLPLHRFPFTVVYRWREESVWVVAVAAQRRRPGYWARRR